MSTVFIGGSRHISRLSAQVKERLNNIINNGHKVVVGDAAGADKAIQKHMLDAAYNNVTVFCSGDQPRNNLGGWLIHSITPPKSSKGFQFYAAKDREMALEADFGLMIWDSKSPGTVLNVLRLVRAEKFAVLINVPDNITHNIKSTAHWNEFLAQCSPDLRAEIRQRATADEWEPSTVTQPGFFDAQPTRASYPAAILTSAPSEDDLAATINAALASGDTASVVDALGMIARARGMTHIAKEAGLARESLYRSLGTGGNPEFSTVLKVMSAVGLRLEVYKDRTDDTRKKNIHAKG